MRVALAGINARYTHANLALFYLRNEILSSGHEARILEFHISQPRLEMLEGICLESPDAILLSVYIWNVALVRSLLPDIHALCPRSLLVLGGPEAGYSPEAWLAEFPFISHIVAGAGEEAVRILAESGFSLPGQRILRRKNRPFRDIGFPYRDGDFPLLANRYVYYESSRGCPFRCSYCLSSREDQALESKDAQTALEELRRILAYEKNWPSPPIVKFVDRTFNAQPERARSIWAALAEAESRATFHFEIHPALLAEDDFRLLESVPPGRFQFEIGVQSVNEAALRAVNRGMDWACAKKAIARLLEPGNIHVHLDAIFGLPGEGMAECGATVDQIMSLKPHQVQLGFLKCLPGTALRDQADAFGLTHMAEAPYQILSNSWLSFQDLRLLRDIDKLVDSVWNANRLEGELDALAGREGGYFRAFSCLARAAGREGYNPSTRQEGKVREFLERALG
jgi:radical SAM superfamily enzyme YgiQ (UPF0313 family)